MAVPPQDQIDETIAALKQYQGELLATREELEKATVSARSKDRTVTVTLTMPGEVKSIKFHGTDYAAMPPAQLAALLVETINKAREKAAAKVQEAFRPYSGFGSDLRESLAGGSELDEILAPLTQVPSFLDKARTGRARGREEPNG